MSFTKILCPTDFSPGAHHALAVAIRLARESGAELVIAHAWHIPPIAYSLEAPFPPYIVQQIIDDAEASLDEAMAEARAAGAKSVSSKVLSGVPWMEIVDALEKQTFDLCVIGTHGRTGLSRVLLGSVAEKVTRHAPCPVLAIRPDGEDKPFHHALVPTDFSENSVQALDLASELVEPTGSITLLHVIEAPVAYSGATPELGREFDKAAAGALAQQIKTHHATKLPITPRARIGYPGGQTLAELDADETIDLVVMGSHGRTGIRRILLGSVAEKIVRHARCPVLVARQRG